MKAVAANALLNEIVGLGQEVLCRPLGDIELRARACAALDEQLQRSIETDASGAARFLDSFAPLLITAIRGALERRRAGDDPRAGKWESLVGALIPHVRDDAASALALIYERA